MPEPLGVVVMGNRGVTILLASFAGTGLAAAALTGAPASGDPGGLAGALRFDGFAAMQVTGSTVAFAGDVNGDGLDDMLVTAPLASAPGAESGAVYVVFGSEQPGPVALNNLGPQGVRIYGEVAGGQLGRSAAAAGDVDHDGYDDIVVGAPAVGHSSGHAFLVFGGPDLTDVDVTDLHGQAVSISGCDEYDHCAAALAGAGDVNDDGYADVLVGAPLRGTTGSAFLLLGGKDRKHLDLTVDGIRILGAVPGGRNGGAVAGAGDVNADGYDDMLVGAPGDGLSGTFGTAVVVYGGPAPAPVNLTGLAGKGFWINAGVADDLTGFALAGPGDVNGDGFDDVAVTAFGAERVDVVFGAGTNADVDLSALGSRGFHIEAGTVEFPGYALAGAGDVNDDGLADLMVGAAYTPTSGAVFVLRGKTDTQPVTLSALGSQGYRLDGLAANDNTGTSVSGDGDINGDDGVDLLVGAPFADPGGLDAAGSAYVLLGIPPVQPTPPVTPTPAATLQVKARAAKKAVPRTGKVTLVRSIAVGDGQRAKVSARITPKKTRKHAKVRTTATKVTMRTKRAPKGKVRVTIRSTGPGVTTRTWQRTWKVR